MGALGPGPGALGAHSRMPGGHRRSGQCADRGTGAHVPLNFASGGQCLVWRPMPLPIWEWGCGVLIGDSDVPVRDGSPRGCGCHREHRRVTRSSIAHGIAGGHEGPP